MAKASRNQAQWLPITVYTWRRYKCRCDNCTAPIDACGVPSVHLSMTSKYQIGPGLSAGNSATALMGHLKLLVGTTLAVVYSRNTPLQDQCCITISLDSCRSMLKQAISPSISYSGDKKGVPSTSIVPQNISHDHYVGAHLSARPAHHQDHL